ncbi:MAG: GNAT family N-acetyltransferase [Chloroflexi bacterium]|nr:GNAT family N-acetyltransferase [Chloroflexota bacterium]
MLIDKTSIEICTAKEIDPVELESFLARMYPPSKSAFLHNHGNWQHNQEDRWLLLKNNRIIGYCAVIPTKIQIQGIVTPALWWVDLIIDPEFRGCGYQTLFDQKILRIADLKLGFPNELAAKIHKKHRWGVRDDMEIRLLPLHPSRIGAVRRASGSAGLLLRLIANFISPVITFYFKIVLSLSKPKNIFRMNNVDIQMLESIYNYFKREDIVTTLRDTAYFYWRYLDAPYASELAFYIVGPKNAPTHFLIARHVPAKPDKPPNSRILDVFGDFQDSNKLLELFKLVTMDAIENGSVQVTIMITLPELKKTAMRAGFWASAKMRFCWMSESKQQMLDLSRRVYWTLGDSDNDESN